MEGLNKQYGTHIIISHSTYELVKSDVIVRKLDVVAVKGKAKGVGVYELRGVGKPGAKEKEFLREFEIGRKLYEEGEFRSAYKHFEGLKKKYAGDSVIGVYLVRCKEFISRSSKNWDGIYRATSK